MSGRYPGYNVLDNAEHWDPVTRALILDRAENVPEITFFTAEEAQVLRAFLDVALAAEDDDPRIPVVEMVDARLARGDGDGYRYEDMPEDGETWRRFAAQLREDGFDALTDRQAYVQKLHDGKSRAWSVVMRYALSAFYSHPWAWNEIGFGGPAYPRGYMRMGVGDHLGREPHEGEEAFQRDPVRQP
jgi:catechol 2,3-dioxygenase-like lactoylglutathione lyase family enzyme